MLTVGLRRMLPAGTGRDLFVAAMVAGQALTLTAHTAWSVRPSGTPGTAARGGGLVMIGAATITVLHRQPSARPAPAVRAEALKRAGSSPSSSVVRCLDDRQVLSGGFDSEMPVEVTQGAGNGPSPGWHACLVRVAIRVRPGAKRTVVGGSHAGALIVRVRERAVDGSATASALAAVAKALGLRTRDVALLSGATSRTKLVEIPDAAAIDFAKLLDGSPSLGDR